MMICISIVSHGHASMLPLLVDRILGFIDVSQLIVTFNISEDLVLPSDPRLQVISNHSPKGFGANHNHAFTFCKSPYFCVLNPDIIFKENPFPQLIYDIKFFKTDLAAPLVLNRRGEIEDSIRYFPSIFTLIKKMILNRRGSFPNHDSEVFAADWVAGMFMLFTNSGFERLGGFDERYFLYYEDVDICVRLWRLGLRLAVNPSVEVIHDARRASRKNIDHMKMHLLSMLTFLIYQGWRLPSISPLSNEKT